MIYDIDRHDSLWAFLERKLQPLSSWKSSSTKRSRDLQKQISKKQIGHLGRCIFWTLTSTAYKTDLQCFFLEYSSKREIHNNMNHTNIKYLRCNMDCHLCGERHGSGADELLERLEGTQRAQRCALKRLTNQFWLGQTFVRTLANCQALYCGAPIITASDCQRCNSQSAAGDEICVRKVHIQFPATKSWNIKSVWCVRLHQLHFRGGAPRRFAFGSFWAADSGRAIHTEHIVVIFSGGRMMWVHCGHWPLPRKTDDPVTTGFSPVANRSSPWCQRFCGYCSAVGIEKISALGNPWCCWSAGWRHGEVIGECWQNGGFLSLCLQKLSNMFSENTVLHHSSEFLAILFRRLLVEVLVQAFRQLYTFFRSVFNPIQLEMESRYQWTLY